MVSDLLRQGEAAAAAFDMLDQRRDQFERLLALRALELVIVMRCRVQVRGEREKRAEHFVTYMTLIGKAVERPGSREDVYNLCRGHSGRCLDMFRGDGWYNVERLYRRGDLVSVDAMLA